MPKSESNEDLCWRLRLRSLRLIQPKLRVALPFKKPRPWQLPDGSVPERKTEGDERIPSAIIARSHAPVVVLVDDFRIGILRKQFVFLQEGDGSLLTAVFPPPHIALQRRRDAAANIPLCLANHQ